MGVDVAGPLRLKREAGRLGPLERASKAKQKLGTNALIGIGLWSLLWLGYNTGPGYFMAPGFPADFSDLIHGSRAFLPILSGWLACALIATRSARVLSWILSPLGLVLLYAVTGLISSAIYSPQPTYALYYGANYLALVLVLLAVALVDDPLADLRKVLTFTWVLGNLLTLSLLGLIPFLGSEAITETSISPLGIRAYDRVLPLLGMAGARNTGFARYAAISTLVALAGVLRRGNRIVRCIWGIFFATSLYALIVANGRTETVAFVGGLVFLLMAERTTRTINILVVTASALLLGFRGFYSSFFLYITRTGHLDFTMTGRTMTWEGGWHVLWHSPWIGYGFQADRYLLGQHMHNGFLHVFLQSGFLGGGAILIALMITWFYLIKYFIFRQPSDKSMVPAEIPAVFLFVMISSVLESTFAYFSAAWLLSAPIVAYVLALDRRLRRDHQIAVREKLLKWRQARNGAPDANSESGSDAPPALAADRSQ
ncbi:MAG TPA: O-antigen ligase family protein [Terriglobia bacterium]|nr:O-antigen ligase family protein [Terriglobia bacterium]